MYNQLTKQCATLAGGIIFFASASLLNASSDYRFSGGQELPQRVGISVGTPADLEDEPENYMKLDGILGDLYDIDQDGSINERDLEMMFDQMGSDDESSDLNGNGTVDGEDMAELLVFIELNQLLPLASGGGERNRSSRNGGSGRGGRLGPVSQNAWPDDWVMPW